MVIAQALVYTTLVFEQPYITQAGEWGGFDATRAASSLHSDYIFTGYCLNWGGFNAISTLNLIKNTPYSGYNTNWGGGVAPGHIGAPVANAIYAGYNTNWGSYREPVDVSIVDIDKDTIIDHPKDQIIYYKLKGWNPMTSNYESWIVSHNVTGHPSLDGALFDPIPGYAPPNVERDVFKTPPSGNTLTNIIVVARWFE